MPWYSYLLIGILIVLNVYCIYEATSANKKLRRLRRRYDYLLRGRGELNMEELLVQHGEDIDKAAETLREIEGMTRRHEESLKKLEGDYSSVISSLSQTLEESINARIDRVERGLAEDMGARESRIRSEVKDNARSVDERLKDSEAKLDEKMAGFQRETESRFEEAARQIGEQREALSQKNEAIRAEMYKRFEEAQQYLDSEKKNLADRTEAVRADAVKRIEESRQELDARLAEADQSMEAAKSEMKDRMDREIRIMSEHLSLAVQRWALCKYNAFDDLAGEQSYSLALLDETGNGLVLTSIYGRNGSSTFAKEIRGGQPVHPLSPEEEKALDQAKSGRKETE